MFLSLASFQIKFLDEHALNRGHVPGAIKKKAVYLHEDVVLGEEEGGDLGQFADRRSVCVRYHGSQFVQRVV